MKDLSRLLLRQYNKGKKFFHQYCLQGRASEEVLKNNLEKCKLHRVQRIKLTESDDKKRRDKIKFTKTEYQICLPFLIYAVSKVLYVNKTPVSHRR